ncbi:hypothetical protein [Candidatus Jettenia sp. AMX1]|uniref:hypothetical protein n=1 Tax=Candidatus Jettenia sp. AMX1 TaxID=2293637 RepID=UPI002554882E|nr:hypothetical protein [Candidatus Jettenia sp. AMX1]
MRNLCVVTRKAKTEKHWRFWGLYCHVCKKEVLRGAYRLAKANDGTPGIDGKSFAGIEAEGVEGFLEGIGQDSLTGRTDRCPTEGSKYRKGWKDPNACDTNGQRPGSAGGVKAFIGTDI